MSNIIRLAASTNAIDAFIYTKRDGVEAKLTEQGIDKRFVVGIGDGDNDLDMLTMDGIFSTGCPGNALDSIKAVVERRHGYVSPQPVLEGFFDILGKLVQRAEEQGYQKQDLVIFTDRDGVLTAKKDYSQGKEFADFMRNSGQTQPRTYILTGSSVGQNKDSGFMTVYGLIPDNLQDNPVIQQDPYLIGCEQGVVWVNVLEPDDIQNIAATLNQDLLRTLNGNFKTQVIARLKRDVFPAFGLHFIEHHSCQTRDQNGVYVPGKHSMVTFNIPYGLRGNDRGREYVQRVLDVMQETTRTLGLEARVVS